MLTIKKADLVFAAPVTTPKNHLPLLDGIRGLAALYVVLHHYLSSSSQGVSRSFYLAIAWTSFGHFAVTVFIVVSGFSLMLPVATMPNYAIKGGWSGYLKRRGRRILPTYWAALTLSILALFVLGADGPFAEISAANVISHFFLLHNLDPDWSVSINMALWSISVEWQIYFIFPAVLLPIWRRSRIVALLVSFALGLLPHFFLGEKWNYDWSFPWFIGLFAMGMALADLYCQSLLTRLSRSYYFATLGLLMVTYVGMKLLIPGANFSWARDMCAGLTTVVMIAWALTDGERVPCRWLKRVFESPVALWLGKFSYSLYLTHCAVLVLLNHVLQMRAISPDFALVIRAFLGVPVAIIVAYGFFCVFERPFLSVKSGRLPPTVR